MKYNFNRMLMKAQTFTADNSPTILTAIGVTGAITSAYLASKATVRAVDIIQLEKEQYRIDGTTRFGKVPADRTEILTKKQKFQLLWKLYIPAAGVLTLTCASIVCANRIGMRRTATAAAAAALAERGWDEYKEQVRDQIGKQKSRQVEDAVAQKKVDNFVASNGPVVVPTEGKVWCMDGYSGRPLMTTINTIERAVNEINRQIQTAFEGSATVSDFYDKIGLEHTSLSDEMGWHAGQVLSLRWTTAANPDQTGPAFHVFDFDDDKDSRPVLRPWSVTPSFR